MEARGSDAWQPVGRVRAVSPALQAYAALTTSAARGAVRDVGQIAGRSRRREPELQAK
jgi:dihydroxy-acid dehydratase